MRYFKVITERERKVGTFYYCNYIPESLVYGIHKDDSLDDIIWQIGLKHPVFECDADGRTDLYWEVCEPRFYDNPFEDEDL